MLLLGIMKRERFIVSLASRLMCQDLQTSRLIPAVSRPAYLLSSDQGPSRAAGRLRGRPCTLLCLLCRARACQLWQCGGGLLLLGPQYSHGHPASAALGGPGPFKCSPPCTPQTRCCADLSITQACQAQPTCRKVTMYKTGKLFSPTDNHRYLGLVSEAAHHAWRSSLQ